MSKPIRLPLPFPEQSQTLGDLLRAVRQERGWGMEQAARAAGVHRATLYRWEQGEAQPRLAELQALLEALGAGASLRDQALALMTAPRARKHVLVESNRMSEQAGLGPMPNSGELLRAMRLRRGFSLEAAAARLGVTPRTLRRWEKTEVWPSAEQLHALCYALGAHCEEVAALTTGRISPTLIPDVERVGTPADLADRFEAFCQSIAITVEQEALKDLSFLAFEAQAWRMAAQHDSARAVLTDIYSRHAQHCSNWERFQEAGEKADRAMEVGITARLPPALLARAAIVGARAAVYRGERVMPTRGLERLRLWADTPFSPEFRAWLLSDMAKYLALTGRVEPAMEIAAQAPRIAEAIDPIELAMRHLDQAQVFLLAGRPGAALATLTPEPVQLPRMRALFALLSVEALRMLGDTTAAQAKLAHVLEDMQQPQWEAYWVQAKALAARL